MAPPKRFYHIFKATATTDERPTFTIVDIARPIDSRKVLIDIEANTYAELARPSKRPYLFHFPMDDHFYKWIKDEASTLESFQQALENEIAAVRRDTESKGQEMEEPEREEGDGYMKVIHVKAGDTHYWWFGMWFEVDGEGYEGSGKVLRCSEDVARLNGAAVGEGE